MTTKSVLWHRLDVPGHDTCRLEQIVEGWRVNGTAIARLDRKPAHLTYQLECDARWCTRGGTVTGWIGDLTVDLTVERSGQGAWLLNGVPVPSLDDCVDLDLGFTPATNLLPIRRLGLSVGQGRDAPAAWLDVSAGTLSRLPQSYERRSETTYWYEAPAVDYEALLEVSGDGFVTRYPGLWETEAYYESPEDDDEPFFMTDGRT